MDWASVAGVLLALAGIVIGQALEGGKLSSLFQPAAFAIVVVGTVGAVLLQSRYASFKRGLRMLALVLRIVGLAVGVRSPSVIAHYICAVVRVP